MYDAGATDPIEVHRRIHDVDLKRRTGVAFIIIKAVATLQKFFRFLTRTKCFAIRWMKFRRLRIFDTYGFYVLDSQTKTANFKLRILTSSKKIS